MLTSLPDLPEVKGLGGELEGGTVRERESVDLGHHEQGEAEHDPHLQQLQVL